MNASYKDDTELGKLTNEEIAEDLELPLDVIEKLAEELQLA